MINLLFILISIFFAFFIGAQIVYASKGEKINYFVLFVGLFFLPYEFIKISLKVYKEIKETTDVRLFSYKNLILLLFVFIENFPAFFVVYIKILIEFQKQIQKEMSIRDIEKSQRVIKYKKDKKDLFEKGLVA